MSREIHTDRDRDTDIQRQRDRETERQRKREKERERERKGEKERERERLNHSQFTVTFPMSSGELNPSSFILCANGV